MVRRLLAEASTKNADLKRPIKVREKPTRGAAKMPAQIAHSIKNDKPTRHRRIQGTRHASSSPLKDFAPT
jgi:hypothetical protein